MAFATKVRFQGKRAVGVDYLRGGRLHRSVEAGEVILCGGAINTPQLLQLSGVGDEQLLRMHDIDLVHHLPGVGENLQDHLEVYIQYASKQPVSIAPGLRWRARPRIAYQWLFHRRGLGATNHFEGGGFARSNEDVDYPNLMFHFLPVAIRYDGSAPTEGHGYQVHIGPMYADTRGWVRIRSKDPKVHPSMQFNYLSTPTDKKEWVEAIRVARDILNQPAFAPYNDGELSPGSGVETDAADPGLGPGRRRDRPAPVLHRQDGHRRDVGRRPRHDARARARGSVSSSTPRCSRSSRTATSTRR